MTIQFRLISASMPRGAAVLGDPIRNHWLVDRPTFHEIIFIPAYCKRFEYDQSSYGKTWVIPLLQPFHRLTG